MRFIKDTVNPPADPPVNPPAGRRRLFRRRARRPGSLVGFDEINPETHKRFTHSGLPMADKVFDTPMTDREMREAQLEMEAGSMHLHSST